MHSTDRTTPRVAAAVPAQGAGPGPRSGPPGPGEGPGTAPVLLHRRDGILPAVAAALSVRGETTTCAGTKAETPPRLHPLVDDFLAALPPGQRERWTGRCPEAVLLSQFLLVVDGRRSKRASRRPMSHGEARKALKHAKLTARRIREDGDPEHGAYAPPCRSCTPLLAHFGVRAVDPDREAR
ncbi:YwqJ-related putative deaminase [Streptomyces sp. HB2AG]|uniref:YwqJ-related putative deaminase n=1 Tax=Streptomyces sp. HB2AG TaxID=2983400 RepID=UPI0022AA5551|nr:YwqJ-related putative deaminase [Streptomyces sp. HB2AG]MCZ2525654.1 YwqJ-related putative deaminase [Streptomyces sp. HB2AG]